MQLRRLLLLSTFVLAVAVLSPATAQGAAHGTDRPLKGTETATAVINVVMQTATVEGPFRYSHLGSGTFHADTTLTQLTPTTSHIAGTNTYVAANGDEVFTTIAGTSTTTSTGSSQVTIVDTITGGTGRFADASGTFTVTGPAATVSFIFPLVTSTGTNTVEGQISY
jgi:hypothetical protein